MEGSKWLVVILEVGNFCSIASVNILITQVATIIRKITKVVIGYASLGIRKNIYELITCACKLQSLSVTSYSYPVSAMELFGTLLLPLRKFATKKFYLIESEACIVPLRQLVIPE